MSQRTKALRVASYNIRKARGLDNRRDPRRVLHVLNELGADVVALQEADKRLGDRPAAISPQMISEETDFQLVPVAQSPVSIGWHGNAVLARKDFKWSHIRHVDLPGLEPRGAVIVGFGDFDFVATHLGLLRASRVHQLRKIRAAIRHAKEAVVAGDFNEWSEERGFETLARFHIHAPGKSFHARRPVAMLDRFALTPGLHVLDSGVHDRGLARRASDHLPIWADIG